MRFDDCAIHILRNGWIDCRDAFHVVITQRTTWAESELIRSIPANNFPLIIYWTYARQELITVISQKSKQTSIRKN